MAKFLLWNVNRRSLDGLIVRLVEQHGVGVLILVERPEADATLLGALQVVGPFRRVQSHERFGVYSRYRAPSFARLSPVVSQERMDFWRFQPTRADTEILLVAVHGLDKINNPDERRELFMQRLAHNIQWAEEQVGHRRTIVIGDFNANPFESAMGSIRGPHAIPVKETAGRSFRSVMGTDYEFFYNPMWRCYGQSRNGPPATYYWNGSGVHEVFWHMLDQVVLRPDALRLFPERTLQILRSAGPTDLLTTSGLPDRGNASDHLPIQFELRLRGGASHV